MTCRGIPPRSKRACRSSNNIGQTRRGCRKIHPPRPPLPPLVPLLPPRLSPMQTVQTLSIPVARASACHEKRSQKQGRHTFSRSQSCSICPSNCQLITQKIPQDPLPFLPCRQTLRAIENTRYLHHHRKLPQAAINETSKTNEQQRPQHQQFSTSRAQAVLVGVGVGLRRYNECSDLYLIVSLAIHTGAWRGTFDRIALQFLRLNRKVLPGNVWATLVC